MSLRAARGCSFVTDDRRIRCATGREESPTELQFRTLEHSTRCYHNEVYRATLAEVFKEAKKNKVRFADLIQQRIRTAQAAVSVSEPERDRRRGRRRR
jgi:hypothetical protein